MTRRLYSTNHSLIAVPPLLVYATTSPGHEPQDIMPAVEDYLSVPGNGCWKKRRSNVSAKIMVAPQDASDDGWLGLERVLGELLKTLKKPDSEKKPDKPV